MGRGFTMRLADFDALPTIPGTTHKGANRPEGGKKPRRTAVGPDASSLGGVGTTPFFPSSFLTTTPHHTYTPTHTHTHTYVTNAHVSVCACLCVAGFLCTGKRPRSSMNPMIVLDRFDRPYVWACPAVQCPSAVFLGSPVLFPELCSVLT